MSEGASDDASRPVLAGNEVHRPGCLAVDGVTDDTENDMLTAYPTTDDVLEPLQYLAIIEDLRRENVRLTNELQVATR